MDIYVGKMFIYVYIGYYLLSRLWLKILHFLAEDLAFLTEDIAFHFYI